jgi:hypothetical protein
MTLKGQIYQELLSKFHERVAADSERIILNSASDNPFPSEEVEKFYANAGLRLVEEHNVIMQRFSVTLKPILQAHNESILESVASVLASYLETDANTGDIRIHD